MKLRNASHDDRYLADEGVIWFTGIHALVRLPLEQRRRDRLASINSGGFISGYRGSPLGGYDQELWRAHQHLKSHDVVFTPGINEDLGATAVWGSQQVNLFPHALKDGVFGLWYGKAPGVDRSVDVLRHANAAGTSPCGGALLVVGDDHDCKSSTLPCQSEYALVHAEVPVLNPSNIQDVLDFGLLGWGMSRYSGLWVGLVALADTMDSAADIHADINRLPILPAPAASPVHIRLKDTGIAQEERVRALKLPAAMAFAREHHINKLVVNPERPRYGIMATGKAYADLCYALDAMGLDAASCAKLGIAVLKIGMPWPLDERLVQQFATGLEWLMVVEAKRPLIEDQVKNALYHLSDSVRPKVLGKWDAHGLPLFPSTNPLTPGMIAKAIAERIDLEKLPEQSRQYIALLEQQEKLLDSLAFKQQRPPYFCSGCPHNVSTTLPEGARGMAGIGCHYMVRWMDRSSELFSQMGGEGVHWIGQAPFTGEGHVFANLGDGTYTHSGILAIRAAVAAKVNITYKILFNDAVAMTGGQQAEGSLTPEQIAAQLQAEGVKNVVILSETPERYQQVQLPMGVAVQPRDELPTIQKAMQATSGVTALIYDQTCAAEKRRRRKRGQLAEPSKRVFINEAVCEGCGDCSQKSNCLSVEPLETDMGRKRKINQSSCNKDYSCIKGFCPSFVTIEGVKPKKTKAGLKADIDAALPFPLPSVFVRPYNIVVTGIGGTGVTTLSAIIGAAAFLEGKGAKTMDMSGLAQKGGPVISHVRLAEMADALHGPRIACGEADLLLAADMVVAAGREALKHCVPQRSRAVVNSFVTPTAEFVKDGNWQAKPDEMMANIEAATGSVLLVNVSEMAEKILGDTIYGNMMLLGYAFQKGFIPLHHESLLRAIELNGAAVEQNKKAFAFGRLLAADMPTATAMAGQDNTEQLPQDAASIVARRKEALTHYQNQKLARRYANLIAAVETAERELNPSQPEAGALTAAVARYYYKLLAYKDEYEVARLYSDGQFMKTLAAQFEGQPRLQFHLAPPLLARKDKNTGHPKKITVGAWMMPLFSLLAKLRFLRGTRLDIFGYTVERKAERALIGEYEASIQLILTCLHPNNLELAVKLASYPDIIRGYGHVKEKNIQKARAERQKLLEAYRAVSLLDDSGEMGKKNIVAA
ncbi:MAG: indolepyruvate ferredoxin oxidoreductase family protein [Alphaproteobacteria bacterium]